MIKKDDKPSALEVRDALVKCFYDVHCKNTELDEMPEGYCEEIVKKAFIETNGDYNNPDKESLKRAMDYLAEFSKNFRDRDTIKANYNKILQLVEKL